MNLRKLVGKKVVRTSPFVENGKVNHKYTDCDKFLIEVLEVVDDIPIIHISEEENGNFFTKIMPVSGVLDDDNWKDVTGVYARLYDLYEVYEMTENCNGNCECCDFNDDNDDYDCEDEYDVEDDVSDFSEVMQNIAKDILEFVKNKEKNKGKDLRNCLANIIEELYDEICE